MTTDISVRPLAERELHEADRVMRLAFGTFLGLPQPLDFLGDADFVRTRWKGNAGAAFVAEAGGEVVGSVFAGNWGSVGIVGPLTVRPDFWDRGVGKRLMEAVMPCFEKWRMRHVGLFTFAQSPKHLALYQRFGFSPRFLTAIMSRPVQGAKCGLRWTKFSDATADDRPALLDACRQLTDAAYEGLDIGREIRVVDEHRLGDTVLLWEGSRLAGLALCHCGAGSEAGGGTCYVKFGAARSDANGESFGHLLSACEEFASVRGLARVVAGVSTARREAYRQMLARGFHSDIVGVAMHNPDEAGYHRSGVYVIDDWR